MTKLEEYAKRLGVETSSTPGDTLTDIDAGKAGYDKYLADVESYKKAEQEAINNEKWWEKLGRWMGSNGAIDTSLPLNQGMNQAIEAYKNMPEDNKPSDDWTDEERWIFGEKYAIDSEFAYDYAKRLNAAKAQQKKEQQAKAIERWTNRNVGNQILGSVASLGLNATLGSVGFLDAMAQMAGRGEIQQHDILLPHEIAGTMQGAVAKDWNEKGGTLNEKIPVIGGKGWGDVYGLGMSIAQSKLAVTAGGGVGSLVQFFGMSASQGVSDALERGATGEQALAFGTVSGLAEAIPEMISLDKFLGIASSETVESVFKNVLKMARAEALEELETSLITEVADRWIMGGKSEFQLRVNELVASGMSLKEAQTKAFIETIEGFAYDSLSGAISGGVSGALGTGINRVNQRFLQTEVNETAKKALTPEQDNLIAEAKKYDTTKKRASALEKKLAEGKELTGYDLRMLANQVSEASRTADVETTRKAIVQQMKDGGLSDGEAKKLGEIALNKAIGNEVSKVQDLMLKRSEVGSKVYNQISEKMMDSGVGDSKWAEQTPIRRLREERKAVQENSEIKVENKPKTGLEALKEDLAKKYGLDSKEYKLNMDSVKDKIEVIDGGLAYKKSSKDSKIHTEGITSPLTHEDIVELDAIERIANELGVDIYVYESTVDKKTGERSYTDKEGNRYSDSGFYDTKRNTIHIDLRAGMNGEGTMLYTASHEVVHFIKENAAEQYEALEKLVTKELVQGGFSIERLIEEQKNILRQNGWDGTEANFEEVAREEMVADACMSFLASKNAVAEIRALKTENKGLWTALKKFFTSLFTKLNKIYKAVAPDSETGKYIADMRNSVKNIRDAFMEGAVAASKNSAQNKKTFEKSYQKSKDIRKNARYVKEHRTALEKLGDTSTTVPMDELLKRYDKLVEIWDSLGGELNSEFLKQWDDKQGKDRAFTVFKAQAGYKYNVELSSMCKKGIPLFEAIDTIVRSEVVDQLKSKTIGKAEKEILYELLKDNSFDIPCAICYVEQARQREGEIINAFLDGKKEKTPAGKTKTYKIGWNETFKALEKEMKSQGVSYTFPEVGRDIATDKYTKAELPAMDAKTEKAFYNSLLKLINREITRYNAEKDPKAKARLPLRSVTPSEIKRCLGGTLSANLKLYKTIAMNPDSRFRINNDLLYSSATTTNLASFHNDLYSLFNMQGGVSGYKLKQGAVVYWGDILAKKWDSSKLRKEGGVRNQSNSDFMMYTLLDHAQMYMDFTAKGYFLQAYTKVISELKLFGLSKGKINASLIPRVVIYRKDNGFEVDIERTRENAGLDENENPIYDDIEGIPHEEAFMLIEDPEYSKSIGGICIGYSDKHINKLLDDNRVQLIIGYHDKTDDPDKRYRGARYAKNYNGENEARVRNSDGTFTTKHVGFNQFVMSAEKLFKKDTTSVEYNGKTYKYDDIPKLAADMYLKMCDEKNYIPAYDQFKGDENYYKLLADFSLYDSEGHYAPHQKVAYNMPDAVPYLDDNGQKQYMPTRDYVKKELKKELTVRDNISEALSDHSENGIIPKFVKQANQLYESQSESKSDRIADNQSSESGSRSEIKHSSRITPEMNTAQRMVEVTFNGQPFWIAMVNQRTGNIEKAWTYEEAESEGFNLAIYEDVMEEDGYVFFTTELLQDNDRIEYDDYGDRLPDRLIKRINEQIQVKKYSEVKKYSDVSSIVERIRELDDKIGRLGKRQNNTIQWIDGAREWLNQRANNEITYEEYESRLRRDNYYRELDDEVKALESEKSDLIKQLEALTGRPWKLLKNDVLYHRWVDIAEKYSPQSNAKANKDIRHSSRTKYTAGQMAQAKANLSHNKVYSKKSAMELVSKIAPNIRNRSFEALSDQLWQGLNTYTSLDDKRQFAKDMAGMFVDRMMVDTLVKHSEWDKAVERMAYIKPAINSINLRDEDISELKYILDKDYPRLRGRWGYKTPSNGEFKRPYGLDEFISDLSREMPGMEHLAEMHPAEALIEVDKLYTELSEQVKGKYESAYNDVPDAFIDEMRQSIEYEIMSAYTELGEKTKISKYLSEKFEYYESRVQYWKGENAKAHIIARWNGILSTKAMHIRELKKGAFYNATQYHEPDLFKNSIEQLANIQWRGNLKPTEKVSGIFAELSKWYTKDNKMLWDDDKKEGIYSETIAKYINKIASTEGRFDANTYAMVYDVMNHLYIMMRNYNKIFRAGRWEDAPDLAKAYLKVMEDNKRNRSVVGRVKDTYINEFLEPMAVAKRADNYNEDGFYTQTVKEMREASIAASIGEMRLRKKYDTFIDENKKYLTNAAKETVKYRGFDIPKIHLIGLYMTMKREHARAGLAINGFEYSIKNKWWDSADKVKVPGFLPDADNQDMINAATEEQMKIIEKSFTDVDKQYIEILETLFNEDLRNLKVERDMERQGYTNATLDYYYPIIRGAMAENVDTTKISDQNRATNSSFNKNTVKGAKQRLVIISADAMVNRHITDMCKYYYMSQAFENYNVLYNCDVSGNPNNPVNIATFAEEAKIWEKDKDYFRKLVADMQGIREPQSQIERALEKLRGNYAKFALGLNAKVLATQFSSIIAAGNVLGFKSLVSLDNFKVSSADIDKYCPIATVRSYEKVALKAMSVTDKLDKTTELFTSAISTVDSFVIKRLFASCQIEAEKRGEGELGTEQNKIAAGKILEQVIIETQQNSYATERSNAMRSKHELIKSVTMFTADSMKLISRVHEAAGELRVAMASKDTARIKKARKQFAKSLAVLVTSSAYLAAIAVLFNWILAKDDEEKEPGEKVLAFGLDALGNSISALPGISDLYEMVVNGFEVESATFDTINNVLKGVSNITKDAHNLITGNGETSIEDVNRDLRTMLYGIGQMTGIPVRNLYNLSRGILDKFSPKATYYLDSKFYETSLKTDFEKAVEEGNMPKTTYILSLLYDDRIESDVSMAQRKEIIRLTNKEYNVLPKSIPDEIKRNGETYVLTDTQKDAIAKEYSKVVPALDKLISSSFYSARSDKDKAYLIDYYHDKYYDIAVDKVLGIKDNKVAIYNTIGFSTYAKLAYLTKGLESDKDKDGNVISGSKKAKLLEIVNKTSIPEGKKLLYIASLGYSLSDEDKQKLCKYLNSLSIGDSTKRKLAEVCGLTYKKGKITP